MHPEGATDRRRARSEALGRTWDCRSGTAYIDAAQGHDGIATAAMMSSDSEKTISAASVKKIKSTTPIEMVAIALPVTWNPKVTVLTDSQAACRNFEAGSVGPVAARLARKHPPESVHVVWTQGYIRRRGNEAAHATAQCLLPKRAFPSRCDDADDEASYSERLNATRLARWRFPLPYKNLSKEEHVIRRL
ncbi:hypothetical protein ISCGN_006438 [Ixodes scapularis]